MDIRHNWTLEEVKALYHTPLIPLLQRTASLMGHPSLQKCALISIKTGGCPEDCKYCAQSSRYQTSIAPQAMMEREEVVQQAREAVEAGATRVCLGAAWRRVRDGKQFDEVLDMVRAISGMGVEVCCTLGMLTEGQAARLAEAGLTAYNHNLDTSREFYSEVITTRTYDDRLRTLEIVERAGIQVCCGGILGMGESAEDRCGLLHTLATREHHPESVPINRLVPIPGTPLGEVEPLSHWEMLRTIATARILMPQSRIRLAAGRKELSLEQQALCFLAGASSIFYGERLLTTENAAQERDKEMCELFWGRAEEEDARAEPASACASSCGCR